MDGLNTPAKVIGPVSIAVFLHLSYGSGGGGIISSAPYQINFQQDEISA
jgi:hypothetical protein